MGRKGSAYREVRGESARCRAYLSAMDKLLTAIVDDDCTMVRALLAVDRELAVRRIDRPKLYQAKIFHWIYAGDTALHLAAAGYRVEVMEVLLAAGADANAAGKHRWGTPLHYAADGFITGPVWDAKRQVKAIRCLLAEEAEIDAQDKNGATALHRAVRTRCAEAVRCLLKAGSDPTRKNKSGSTAFHLAVQNTGRGGSGAPEAVAAQRAIIEEMIARGVSPKLRDGGGKTVAEWARSGWIREMVG